jgi:hypothetical protein
MTPEHRAPEGGRPVSEMQRKIAQAIYDAPTTFDGDQIAVHLGLSMHIDEAIDSVEKAKSIVMQVCMDAALAAMKAMREPTRLMIDAAYAAHDAYEDAPPPKAWCGLSSAFRAAFDAEISIAEGGKDG